MNPRCQLGEHQACNGRAWDHELDEVMVCMCPCHLAPIDESDTLSVPFPQSDPANWRRRPDPGGGGVVEKTDEPSPAN